MHGTPPPERALLTLAFRRSANAVHAALADIPPGGVSAPFTVELRGLPEASLARVRGSRRTDGTARLDVMSLDGRTYENLPLIEVPEPSTVTPLQVEDDSIRGKSGTRWYPAPGGLQPEVVDLDDSGTEVVRQVNTDRYCFQLHCACGTVRYAKKNSVHQVDRCRVCAKKRRHAYQVTWQREKRAALRK